MRVFWVVGESSGDHHAAELIRSLRDQSPDWEHFGMCGEAMRAAGCHEVADLSEAAMMGLTEVVRHLPKLWKLRTRLINEIVEKKIDVVVFVDFPDFNLAIACALRRRFGDKFKIMYYVSPQVWAWRKGRAKSIAKVVDEMAVLFPFEADVYKPHGLNPVFFGHPMVGHVKPSADMPELRQRFGLGEGDVAVTILPGSRRHEVERHLAVQLATLKQLRNLRPERIKALIVRANTIDRSWLETFMGDFEDYEILDGGAYDALAASHVGLIKSGTSTVEAALIGTPFVVLYKVSGLTYFFGRLLIKGVRFITMANVLTDREVVKERIQNEADPEILCRDLLKIWDGDERTKVRRELTEVAATLGEPGGTTRLASWMIQRFGGDQ